MLLLPTVFCGVVYPDDPAWYFTDYNWATDLNRAKFTANPGAYFKACSTLFDGLWVSRLSLSV
jgi:hypothetical protein